MAKKVVLDFETFYGREFTLSKMSIESYVRSSLFKVHGFGYMVIGDDDIITTPSTWVSALSHDLQAELDKIIDKDTILICHHAQFDGFILSEIYNIVPKMYVCTMSLGRAIVPPATGGSLKKLAAYFGLGEKGEDLVLTKDVWTLTEELDHKLGVYCVQDVALTYALHVQIKKSKFVPASEYRICDLVMRMFCVPQFIVDVELLTDYLHNLRKQKQDLLEASGATKEVLNSSPKFCALLRSFGVEPPMKISPRTGKETPALAKTDQGLIELMEHPDFRVQAIVAARMSEKSTLMETRTERFISIGERGTLPIYLKYGATQTHRLSGGDKINPQNMTRGSVLRKALRAPAGYKLVVCDSSNIELRINMALSQQEDAVELLRAGKDLYCVFASKLFNREITKKDKNERQLGKIALLGLGYGMGKRKFAVTASYMGCKDITQESADMTVDTYRRTYPMIPALWRTANTKISSMMTGIVEPIDPGGICMTGDKRITLPTGLPLRYSDLRVQSNPETGRNEFVVGDKMVTRLYGGKLVENLCQALARNIIMEQTLDLSNRWNVIHSVHDEIVMLVPEVDAEKALEDAVAVFSTSPAWWPGVPLAAEGDIADCYGDAK